MKNNLPEFHINYITPKPGAVLLREMSNYASSFLGISRKKLHEIVRSNEKISNTKRKIYKALALLGFNQELFDVGLLIKKIYGFENRASAIDAFLKAQTTTTKLILELVKIYGLDVDRFGLKNEVKIPDPSFRRILTYLNPRSNSVIEKGTSPRSRFEELREILLVDLALRNSVRGKKEHPSSKISELQQRFNNELFEGQAGAGQPTEFHVIYNREAGAVNVTKKEKRRRQSVQKIEEMRIVKSGDRLIPVQVDFDEKSGSTKIIKLLNDFYEKGINAFDPYGNDPSGKPLLLDRQRFQVVVHGSDKDIKRIHEKIAVFFDSVTEKKINSDHGQMPTVKQRFIAQYKGIPIELIYYDVKGYINSKQHVGKLITKSLPIKIGKNYYQADFELYDGSAHELYEIRRSLSLLFLIFPYEIYKREDQTEQEYINEVAKIVSIRSKELGLRMLEKAKSNN